MGTCCERASRIQKGEVLSLSGGSTAGPTESTCPCCAITSLIG